MKVDIGMLLPDYAEKVGSLTRELVKREIRSLLILSIKSAQYFGLLGWIVLLLRRCSLPHHLVEMVNKKLYDRSV